MFNDFATAYLKTNTKETRAQKYIILYGSAIRKDYANKMEGLAYIDDGASKRKDKIEIGYHRDNVVGGSKSADGEVNILPIYSVIYSKELDPGLNKVRENRKVLNMHKSFNLISMLSKSL